MKIKNLKISRRNAAKIIAGFALSGALIVGGNALMCLSITPEDNVIIKQAEELDDNSVVKEFSPEEHIISEKLKIKQNYKPIQIPAYEGYKLVGITSEKYGNVATLYVNEESVTATATGIDKNGNYIYSDFGKPLNYNEQTEKDINDIFEEGEHILAIPISNPFKESNQIEYHEGYEIIDIDSYMRNSRHSQYFGGGYVIYVNNTKVTCEKSSDGSYTEFGTPTMIQKEKTL